MLNVFRYLSGSYATAALIGSDAPDMPEEYIEAAFKALEDGAEAVFGPADDGGYYLVGLKRPLPSVFEGIEWSTASVLEKTIERLDSLSIPFSLLPVWHDIDRPADLSFLIGNPGCPESSAFLAARGFR